MAAMIDLEDMSLKSAEPSLAPGLAAEGTREQPGAVRIEVEQTEMQTEHTLNNEGSSRNSADNSSDDLEATLFNLLVEENEISLIQTIDNNLNVVNADNGWHTLLQAAVWKGLIKVVHKLIELEADLNKTIKKDDGETRSPAILATHKGYDDILEALLSKKENTLSAVDNQSTKFTALHVAVVFPSSNTRCLQLLLEHAEKHELDVINAQDSRGYTALHYAAEKNQVENVKLLLKYKANLFLINNQGDPAFCHVGVKNMNNYLDERIKITDTRNIQDSSTDPAHSYFLELDYKFMAPIKHLKCPATEMDPLLKLSDSPKHRLLFTHPILKSFLYLKWYRIFWFFYINFTMYLTFTICLSTHIYHIVTPSVISDSGNMSAQDVDDGSPDINSITREWCWWFTLVLLVCLALRELVQVCMSLCRYFGQVENWLEVVLLVLTALLLDDGSGDNVHAMSAAAILLAYTELVLLIGRHPSLATYITMFTQVSRNFIKLLLWYSVLIIAFGFSFYIMFQHCDSKEDCKNNFFNNLGYSLFKTVIMLTGELEASNLKFSSNSIISHIIFLLFIFFITIVLINLLNGLAISDIRVIIKEAEIVSCVAQVKFYAEIESTLLCICIKRIRVYLERTILLLSGPGNTQPQLQDNKLKIILNDRDERNRMVPDVRNACWRKCATDGSCCLQSTCMREWCHRCAVFATIVSEAQDLVAQRDAVEVTSTDTQQILARLESLECRLKEALAAGADQGILQGERGKGNVTSS